MNGPSLQQYYFIYDAFLTLYYKKTAESIRRWYVSLLSIESLPRTSPLRASTVLPDLLKLLIVIDRRHHRCGRITTFTLSPYSTE